MKKIAILATYLGKVDRGAETFVIELAKRLSKDYEVTVFSLGVNEQLKNNTTQVKIGKGPILNAHSYLFDNIKIYRKVINRFYFMLPEVLFQKKFTKYVFKNHIEKNNYDILFPNNGVWGAKYSKKYREATNTPYIYTGHGGIGDGEKLIIDEKPDMYICLNEDHLKWAKQYTDKAMVIHNGVDVEKFSLAKKENETKKVISVGALTSFKRHHLTIEAISKLQDTELLILGRGELEKEIKDLGKKKLGDRFTLKSVPYNEINKYYEQADLFVLPSKDEPFGIVYLEAMASNLPVVAPDDGVRREIVGDSGLYCNCENPQEYANAIEKALNIDWDNKPRERSNRFDWKIINNEYKQLINSLL